MRIILIICSLYLMSCTKEYKVYPIAEDPNVKTFDSFGGTLNFNQLSTLSALHIPNGTFDQATDVGYAYQFGAYYTNVVDSIYPSTNGYASDGLFFYPFNTTLNKTCTLDWPVSTQNPNINISNIHFYKIDNALTATTPSSGNYAFYPSHDNYIEILDYSMRTETVNGTTYNVYELPIDSFEYYYLLCVEKT